MCNGLLEESSCNFFDDEWCVIGFVFQVDVPNLKVSSQLICLDDDIIEAAL
jgi:hypothetical protein